MSHFILQSTKIAKITDGTTTLVVLGYAGKDNNVHYYGTPKTTVDFFRCLKTQEEIEVLRHQTARSVLEGSTQLKDIYNKPLREQAPVAMRRLDSGLKNAKTYQVERIHPDGTIEWGSAQSEIARDVKVTCRFSKDLAYKPIDPERIHPMDKATADFVKQPSSDPQSIGAVIEHLDLALAYLDPKVVLTSAQFVHLLSHGSDWNARIALRHYEGTVTQTKDAVALAEGPFFRYGSTAAQLMSCLSEPLRSDPQTAAQMLHVNPWLYPHMEHPSLRANEALGRIAVQLETANYAHAPLAVRSDKQCALHCLKARASELMDKVPPHLLEDREVAITAVTSSGSVLKHLPEHLRADIHVCKSALRPFNQNEVIQHASTSIQQKVQALIQSGSQPSILDAVAHLAAQDLAVQEARTLAKTLPPTVSTPKRDIGRSL